MKRSPCAFLVTLFAAGFLAWVCLPLHAQQQAAPQNDSPAPASAAAPASTPSAPVSFAVDEVPLSRLLVRTGLSLALVLGLIVGAGLLYRFAITRPVGPLGRTRLIQVLDRAYLDPKKHLFLVRAGTRRYLLASAPGSAITLIDRLDDEPSGPGKGAA